MDKWARRSKLDRAKMRPAELYIACFDIDFSWLPEEITEFIRLWKYGIALDEIADKLDRPIDDVVMLLYDLSTRGKVKQRRGGLYGEVREQKNAG